MYNVLVSILGLKDLCILLNSKKKINQIQITIFLIVNKALKQLIYQKFTQYFRHVILKLQFLQIIKTHCFPTNFGINVKPQFISQTTKIIESGKTHKHYLSLPSFELKPQSVFFIFSLVFHNFHNF